MRLSLTILALLIGCRSAPTQTWVFLHLDPAFEVDADQLQVVITSRGEEVVSRVDAVDRSREVIANLFLVPDGGDVTRSWEVHATLLRGTDALVEIRVGGGYTAGEVRVVHAHFDTAPSCLALPSSCGPGRTCQSGRCVGACFETVAETDESTHQLARCGECATCGDGACVPAANDTPCGCMGDVCRDGECDPQIEVREVWLGQSHACAKTSAGLWCWGSARTRQTTFRDATDRPRRVEAPEARNIVDMALGDEFSCATWIRSGPVYGRTCWGYTGHGSFAMGMLPDTVDPMEVVDEEDEVAHLRGGRYFQCGLRESGLLQCSGGNDSGQLARPASAGNSFEWVDIPGRYDEFATSGSGVCARNAEGIWCWGISVFDGIVRSSELARVPDALDGASIQSIVRGDSRACGLDSEGRSYCWGLNRGGLLGVDGPDPVTSPTAIDSELRFSTLSAETHVCGISVDGDLYCWGPVEGSLLGTGDSRSHARPTPVRVDADENWTDVTIGRGYSCAIRDDRQLYCWGENSGDGPAGSRFAGRLGLGLGTNGSESSARVAIERPMRVCFEAPTE